MRSLSLTHLPTLAIGLLSLAVLVAAGRYLRKVPAALLAMLVAGLAAWLFSLEPAGVSMIGKVPAGLPMLSLPRVPLHHLPVLLAEAAGLALVSFSSMMLVARSFADKNRYDIDRSRDRGARRRRHRRSRIAEFRRHRFGYAHCGGGICRCAHVGRGPGRRRRAGAGVLSLTAPLQFVPTVALAAILITTGLSLINWEDLRAIYRIDPQEIWLAMIATVGVLLFGAIQAISFVVVLALLRFVRLTARRRWKSSVSSPATRDQSIERHPAAASPPDWCCSATTGRSVFQRAALQEGRAQGRGGCRTRRQVVRH